jgi:ureidoacrylate peracid hydrolase
MHKYSVPEHVKQRALRRIGKPYACEVIEAEKTALIVVDMQNHFVAEGFPAEVAAARDIVPNINRMAAAVRAAGGTVVWIQTSAVEALTRWGNHHKYGLKPETVQKRLASLDESAEGYKLYPKMDAKPGDLRVKKATFSGMMPGSCNLHDVLSPLGISTVLITGTATNVCCETTARDAMVLDYRVVMLSDGNATWTDEEHAATLNTFQMFFGDVMTTDEALSRLQNAGAVRKIA